jgi:outer membrane lipoprotein-sorting protein
MGKSVTFFCTLLLMGAALNVQSQTADDIINNYLTALGGKEKLNSIKTLYMEGVTVMQNGNEINSKTYRDQDKLLRRDIDFGMGSSVTIVTDKEGWFSNPRNGGAFQAIPADRLKNQQADLDIRGGVVDYAAKGSTVELLGKEKIGDVEAYKIKLTPKTGNEVIYYFDPKTWYVIRETRKGGMPGGGTGGAGRPGGQAQGDGTVNIDYSNYQKTADGYVFPMTVTFGFGGSTNYEKIDVNKPIDEKLYKPNN